MREVKSRSTNTASVAVIATDAVFDLKQLEVLTRASLLFLGSSH